MKQGRLCVWGFLFALVVCLSLPVSAQQQVRTVQWNVHHDVSLPLGELAAAHPFVHVQPREFPEHVLPHPAWMSALKEDPVIQRTVERLSPAAITNFEGLGAGITGFSSGGTPPDTNGAVGSTQYVQQVNTSIGVFSKTNGQLLSGPTNTNTLWSGFGGGCQTNNDGDGIVLYDRLANRWVITQFSVTTTPYLACVAVSTTSDATGTYNRYSFQFSNFPDYPKLGIWPDAYYMTFNMFNGSMFVGPDACALNRSAMLNGQSAQMVCFQQSPFVGSLLPADMDGTTAPPSGSRNYLADYGNDALNLYRFHVDFSNTSNSTFTGPTVISVASFTPLCSGGTCVPQQGTTNQLDSLADRLMFRLAYRNFGSHESLYVSHSVTAGSSGGVRWYEIQNPAGTPTVAQQGTFAPDSNFRWMPSIASDSAGDIAVGYSVSSSSIHPSISYAARTPSDPSGTLESEVSVKSGTGSETGATRWGDYSAMTVDPTDDCTFWYTTEYYAATGEFNWNTRIVNLKFAGCGSSGTPAASLSPTSLTFAAQNVGTTSSPQAVTLTNNGTATLSITSIAANGDFAQTNNCGSSLGTNLSCTINVTFTPTAAGTRTGTLSVTDNASGSPQTVSLSGTGQSVSGTPGASLSPTSLTFAAQNVGTTSAAQAATLTNNGTATLSITSIATSGDFAQTNNCGSSLAMNTSCAINVTFTPAATGTRTGTLSVTDNASGSPQTASLSGTGQSSPCTSGTLSNGGFETGDTSCWTTGGVFLPTISTLQKHSGTYSAQLGASSTPEPNGDSSLYQAVNIPSNAVKATLTFWYWPSTTDTITYDWQEAQVRNSSGTTLAQIFKVASNTKTWTQVTFDLTPYAGQTVRLYFNVHGDGFGDLTYMYLDDVAVSVVTGTQLIQNGGFETGNLSSWTTGGVFLPTATTAQKHSGSYSAQLGASSTPEPNGNSSLYQTIAIPSTISKATLSFWYWPATTDTINYDWQEAQVQNSSGTTLAQIFKVASNSKTWTQVTFDLTPYKGQTIRISFNDHQDGFGDLTYMYLDDVSVITQ